MQKKIIFIGTSFSVNITSIALRIAIMRGIDVDIVDPNPICNNDNLRELLWGKTSELT